jgi:G3E family GTPase
MKKKIYFFNGALGSGKTTLINQLILSETLGKFFIIENEVAGFAIDNLCLHIDPKQMKVFAGECICCSDPKELVNVLDKVSAEDYENIVIESSGVTSLNNLLVNILSEKSLSDKYEIGACIFLVDALGISRTNVNDIELADFVVVTKYDELKTFTQQESLDKFIKVDHRDVIFITKSNLQDKSWIRTLLDTKTKTFRDWALKVNDVKHHGQNFVKVLNEKDLEKFNPEKGFAKMKEKNIFRVKGFYRKKGLIYHVEMTPELKKVEIQMDFKDKFGVVVIGGNKLLMEEYINEGV